MGGRTRGSFAAAIAVVQLLGAAAMAASPSIRLRTCLGEPATHVGTPGDDHIVGTSGRDVIVGGGGEDFIRGGDGRDRICGGSGIDTLDGRYGDDVVNGGLDEDRILGGPGDDLLLGGPGLDHMDGDAGNDTLVGGPEGDLMFGGDGRSDDDFLFGGGGNDSIDGGIGGRDEIYGGPDDDFLRNGLVSYEFSPERVVVDLATTADRQSIGEGSDRITDPEGIVGSAFDDWIFDDDGSRSLDGLGGNDVIRAGGGDDRVDGGPGSDELDGGPGSDAVSFEESPAGVTASLLDGRATGAGDDTLAGFENVEGSFFDDHITGDDGPNELEGSFGVNTVLALGGDDRVRGAQHGNAGDGRDHCSDPSIEGCESFGPIDSPYPYPSLDRPRHLEDVHRLGTIGGGIGGGLGQPDEDGIVVFIRRTTPGGCSWWDGDRRRFVRGGCGTPLWSFIRGDAEEWSLHVDAQLAPGRYLLRVDWPDGERDWACGGLYAPMCVELDVR